jgi:hypothetical protein
MDLIAHSADAARLRASPQELGRDLARLGSSVLPDITDAGKFHADYHSAHCRLEGESD